jgi:hypothetical protein
LKTQFWSRLEPKSLFLLVAGIYRETSLLGTKIQTYVTNDKTTFEIEHDILTGRESTTANSDLPQLALMFCVEVFRFRKSFILARQLYISQTSPSNSCQTVSYTHINSTWPIYINKNAQIEVKNAYFA